MELTPGEKAKITKIASEIAKATRSGPPVTINQTASFSGIRKKGTKIRIARAFSRAVSSGELKEIRKVGTTAANHAVYAAGGGAGRKVDGGGARKGFFAKIFGG